MADRQDIPNSRSPSPQHLVPAIQVFDIAAKKTSMPGPGQAELGHDDVVSAAFMRVNVTSLGCAGPEGLNFMLQQESFVTFLIFADFVSKSAETKSPMRDYR